MNTKHIPIVKYCDCGQVHIRIPEDAKITSNGDLLDGAYWVCECTSNLFVPAQDIADAIKKLARLNAEIQGKAA